MPCARELPLEGYVCPECGGNLEVVLAARKIKKRLSRRKLNDNLDLSIWRYSDFLPVADARHRPRAAVGWTPLYESRVLGSKLGLKRLYIKDDGRNPSASFKDRASAVIVGRALDLRRRLVAGASTGNAASSLACMAAGTGLKTVVFVPKAAPAAKVAQLLLYGAEVVKVRGTYDDAFELSLEACAEFGWYNRNTGFNPFTREGKKTCAFEIVEQLGWKVPDYVFVPVGDGNILSGLWKGFRDFKAVGLIHRLPRLVAVQAAGSAAVAKAFKSGKPIRAARGKTLADSISVSLPRDGEAALRALKESKGFAVTVSDKDILAAMRLTAQSEGVFAEPAAAAAVAGVKKAAGTSRLRANMTVVALITGSGLKDVAGAMKAAGKSHTIRPTMRDLRRLRLS